MRAPRGGAQAGPGSAAYRGDGVDGAVRAALPLLLQRTQLLWAQKWGGGGLWETVLGMSFCIPTDNTGHAP